MSAVLDRSLEAASHDADRASDPKLALLVAIVSVSGMPSRGQTAVCDRVVEHSAWSLTAGTRERVGYASDALGVQAEIVVIERVVEHVRGFERGIADDTLKRSRSGCSQSFTAAMPVDRSRQAKQLEIDHKATIAMSQSGMGRCDSQNHHARRAMRK